VRERVHEYSIVQALIERVEQEATARGARRVVKLWVRLGELSGVEPGLLATAYDTFSERTICEGAPMELDRVPASWACRRCERPTSGALRCERCSAPSALVAGDEILLSRIEMEVPDV
jgi:hydrogenase nickel incorporation protein HypA/HybF